MNYMHKRRKNKDKKRYITYKGHILHILWNQILLKHMDR